MDPPSLESETLIKLAITFWVKEGSNKNIIKQVNGIIQMESALLNLKKSVIELNLSPKLKNRLIDIIERIGYELFTFINRSPFNVLKSDLDFIPCIVWTPFGLIQEKSTYLNIIYKNLHLGIAAFKSACFICLKDVITHLWDGLSSNDKTQLESRAHNVLVAYWVYFLKGILEEFSLAYGYLILGFEAFRSLEFNMVKYCLSCNLKTAALYFVNLLSEEEKHLFFVSNTDLNYCMFLQNLLNEPRPEHFKYICSFLELPLADLEIYEAIVGKMPTKGLEDLIDFLLKQVNLFGDLHYNIFRRVVKISGPEMKEKLMSKLDYYALNLIGKGRLETFEGLLPASARSKLFKQLLSRLTESRGLALFFTILSNNQKHLLFKCFKYLSNTDEQELFFKTRLDIIINGCQYDDINATVAVSGI